MQSFSLAVIAGKLLRRHLHAQPQNIVPEACASNRPSGQPSAFAALPESLSIPSLPSNKSSWEHPVPARRLRVLSCAGVWKYQHTHDGCKGRCGCGQWHWGERTIPLLRRRALVLPSCAGYSAAGLSLPHAFHVHLNVPASFPYLLHPGYVIASCIMLCCATVRQGGLRR
jgi:hypothetical protein